MTLFASHEEFARELTRFAKACSRGDIGQALASRAALTLHDKTSCREREAARKVIEQLLDPQVDEEHAHHGRWVGNEWVRESDVDCPVCEWEDARLG